MGDNVLQHINISALTPDDRNANKGTERGTGALEQSLRKFGAGRSVLVDRDGRVIAGNKTVEGAASIGLDDVIVVQTDGTKLVAVQRTDLSLDDTTARELAIADNRVAELNLEWEPDALQALIDEGAALDGLFSDVELAELLKTQHEQGREISQQQARQTLAERFLLPPFSVLDARQGYWQDRKRAWVALGIQSELGRGANSSPGHTVRGDGKGNGLLGFSEQARTHYKGNTLGAIAPNERDILSRSGSYSGKNTATSNSSQARLNALQKTGDSRAVVYGTAGNASEQTGTSIFDPVLCEALYTWFCPPAGVVLDPFAGGSVRGVVAACMGRQYTGIDLSAAQLAANEAQANSIVGKQPRPKWLLGDARNTATLAPGAYDMLLTCPPYYDLEVYSDDPADLSTAADYPAFLAAYRAIMREALALLKTDRFACITVGDVRDKAGIYRNFVSDTIAAFQDAGASLYNEAILVTACGSLPIRAARQFPAGRKLGKTHQNVLVFVKGDPTKAVEACGPVEVGELPEPCDDMGLNPELI